MDGFTAYPEERYHIASATLTKHQLVSNMFLSDLLNEIERTWGRIDVVKLKKLLRVRAHPIEALENADR